MPKILFSLFTTMSGFYTKMIRSLPLNNPFRFLVKMLDYMYRDNGSYVFKNHYLEICYKSAISPIQQFTRSNFPGFY